MLDQSEPSKRGEAWFEDRQFTPTPADLMRQSPLKQTFWLEKTLVLPELGEVRLLKDRTGRERVLQKSFTFNKQSEFEAMVRQTKGYISLTHPGLLRVLDFDTEEKSSYCSVHYRLEIYFEGFEQSLDSLLQAKARERQRLSQFSLQVLLQQIGGALALLKEKGLSYKSLNAKLVGVDSLGGEISRARLVPLVGGSADLFDAAKRQLATTAELYLAPELYDKGRFLFRNQMDVWIDPYLADAFSLGLLVLRSGVLTDTKPLYAGKNFNQDLLAKWVAEFKKTYPQSTEMLQTVTRLVTIQPKARLEVDQSNQGQVSSRVTVKNKPDQSPKSPGVAQQASVRSKISRTIQARGLGGLSSSSHAVKTPSQSVSNFFKKAFQRSGSGSARTPGSTPRDTQRSQQSRGPSRSPSARHAQAQQQLLLTNRGLSSERSESPQIKAASSLQHCLSSGGSGRARSGQRDRQTTEHSVNQSLHVAAQYGPSKSQSSQGLPAQPYRPIVPFDVNRHSLTRLFDKRKSISNSSKSKPNSRPSSIEPAPQQTITTNTSVLDRPLDQSYLRPDQSLSTGQGQKLAIHPNPSPVQTKVETTGGMQSRLAQYIQARGNPMQPLQQQIQPQQHLSTTLNNTTTLNSSISLVHNTSHISQLNSSLFRCVPQQQSINLPQPQQVTQVQRNQKMGGGPGTGGASHGPARQSLASITGHLPVPFVGKENRPMVPPLQISTAKTSEKIPEDSFLKKENPHHSQTIYSHTFAKVKVRASGHTPSVDSNRHVQNSTIGQSTVVMQTTVVSQKIQNTDPDRDLTPRTSQIVRGIIKDFQGQIENIRSRSGSLTKREPETSRSITNFQVQTSREPSLTPLPVSHVPLVESSLFQQLPTPSPTLGSVTQMPSQQAPVSSRLGDSIVITSARKEPTPSPMPMITSSVYLPPMSQLQSLPQAQITQQSQVSQPLAIPTPRLASSRLYDVTPQDSAERQKRDTPGSSNNREGFIRDLTQSPPECKECSARKLKENRERDLSNSRSISPKPVVVDQGTQTSQPNYSHYPEHTISFGPVPPLNHPHRSPSPGIASQALDRLAKLIKKDSSARQLNRTPSPGIYRPILSRSRSRGANHKEKEQHHSGVGADRSVSPPLQYRMPKIEKDKSPTIFGDLSKSKDVSIREVSANDGWVVKEQSLPVEKVERVDLGDSVQGSLGLDSPPSAIQVGSSELSQNNPHMRERSLSPVPAVSTEIDRGTLLAVSGLVSQRQSTAEGVATGKVQGFIPHSNMSYERSPTASPESKPHPDQSVDQDLAHSTEKKSNLKSQENPINQTNQQPQPQNPEHRPSEDNRIPWSSGKKKTQTQHQQPSSQTSPLPRPPRPPRGSSSVSPANPLRLDPILEGGGALTTLHEESDLAELQGSWVQGNEEVANIVHKYTKGRGDEDLTVSPTLSSAEREKERRKLLLQTDTPWGKQYRDDNDEGNHGDEVLDEDELEYAHVEEEEFGDGVEERESDGADQANTPDTHGEELLFLDLKPPTASETYGRGLSPVVENGSEEEEYDPETESRRGRVSVGVHESQRNRPTLSIPFGGLSPPESKLQVVTPQKVKSSERKTVLKKLGERGSSVQRELSFEGERLDIEDLEDRADENKNQERRSRSEDDEEHGQPRIFIEHRIEATFSRNSPHFLLDMRNQSDENTFGPRSASISDSVPEDRDLPRSSRLVPKSQNSLESPAPEEQEKKQLSLALSQQPHLPISTIETHSKKKKDKDKEHFTRLDENNELEFLPDKYFSFDH